MTPTDYASMLEKEFQEYAELIRDRQRIEFELAKKEQFIRATINMVPDDKRQDWEMTLELLKGEEPKLSDAIRRVLMGSPRDYFTATEVRKALVGGGFDFSRYTSNPLPSVHAALKRMKSDEVETKTIDGVMAWRWIGYVPVIPSFAAGLFDGQVPGASFTGRMIPMSALLGETRDRKRLVDQIKEIRERTDSERTSFGQKVGKKK